MANFIKLQSGVIIPQAQFSEFQQPVNKKPVLSEIAVAGGTLDITQGYLPANMIAAAGDTVLTTRGSGDYSIYEELARDDQVITCRKQREMALIGKSWGVEPGDSSRRAQLAADRLKRVLQQLPWDDITQKMLSALLYGFAAAEILWATDGSEITISSIKVRNRRRFGFLPNGELRLRTLEDSTNGMALPAGKFWAFSCGADHDDEPYGLGLGHYLYWPVFFKKNGLKFWLTFLEKFGQPTAVGRYPASSSDDEKSRLLNALASIQSNTAIRIPDSMMIELLEAKRSGTADYTDLYDRMNAAISKIYLGHSGSADSTPGRLGGEDDASDIRADLVRADADLICQSFNCTVARWLTFYNDGPDVAPPKVWRDVSQPEDLKSCADKDRVLFDLGFAPRLDYISDKYGDNYDFVGTGRSTNQIPKSDSVQTSLGAEFSEAERQLSAVDPNTDRLNIEGAQAGKILVDKIFSLVEKANSLPNLRDILLDAYAELDASELADVMAIAYSAMNLSGRFDVDEGG